MSQEKPDRWVYLIGSPRSGVVKIGVSKDPERRLRSLRTGSPVALRLLWKKPGAEDLEEALHAYFSAYRVRGEWFDFGDGEPVAYVEAAFADLITHGLDVRPAPYDPVREADRLVLDAIRTLPTPVKKPDVVRTVGMTGGVVGDAVKRLVTGGLVVRGADWSLTCTSLDNEVSQ